MSASAQGYAADYRSVRPAADIREFSGASAVYAWDRGGCALRAGGKELQCWGEDAPFSRVAPKGRSFATPQIVEL